MVQGLGVRVTCKLESKRTGTSCTGKSPQSNTLGQAGASLYTQKLLSPKGARAKAWCLLVHSEVSLSLCEE